MDNSAIFKELDQPLDMSVVKQREAFGGRKLDYLAGWYVQKRANDIFGYDGWSMRVVSLEKILERAYENNYGKSMIQVAYMAVVEVTCLGVTRQDSGTGDGQANIDAVYPAYELAIKEATTDAMKRAFKGFGNQFGLPLYDHERVGVVTENDKRARKMAEQACERILKAIAESENPLQVAVDEEKAILRFKEAYPDLYDEVQSALKFEG